MRGCMIGPKRHDPATNLLGFRHASLRLQCAAHVKPCFSEIRLQSHGFPLRCFGILSSAQGGEYDAEVVMRYGKIRLDGEGFCNEFNGDVIFTHLTGHRTKQMQGVMLVGIGLQYPLADNLCFA